ncbi:MAG TPA: condensation domain-containing protein, partial [Thermoanaerobaculia bacterium]|nr:condensation domain-containing protein [Thermoanaerobaculia bacterium]
MSVLERAERLKNLPPEQRRLLLKMLQEEAARAGAARGIPRRAETGPAPLSFAQQRLWFLDRLAPGNPAYNLAFAARLEGALDVDALARTLAEISRRHEVLRSRFVTRGEEPVQETAPPPAPFLPVVDLSGIPDRVPGEADRLTREEARRPFDLARGPLLRAVLLRTGREEHRALFTLHHIAADGWSMANLTREVAALYGAFAEGRPSPLPELPVQYADFAVWQRERLSGEALEARLSWWRERLAGAPPVLDLPADRPRPAAQSFRGANQGFSVGEDLAAALEQRAREAGTSLFTLLLAAFQAFLARLSGQTDVVVGSPVANREHPELEPLVGFFVNVLALPADLSSSPSFRGHLARVTETVLGAFEHQDLPFEKLVDELGIPRSLAHPPLFQSVLAFQNTPAESLLRLGEGLRLETRETENGTAKFDWSLALARREGHGIGGSLQYSTDLFDAGTVARFLGAFERLLEGVAADPDAPVWELPLLTAAERRQLVSEWSGAGEVFRPAWLLHERFAEQAARNPDAPALSWDGETLSYGELDRRSNGLAWRLLAEGVAPGDRVALCAERGLEMVVGILGILKAGGAYVPLDPAYPRERLAWLLEDAGAPVLVVGPGAPDGLPARRVLPLADD